VEITGSVTMSNNLVLVNNLYAGTLKAVVSGTMTVGNNASLDVSGANLFVNGSMSVDNDLQARLGNTFGGSGTVFLKDTDSDGAGTQTAQIQGFYNPGSDFDGIGKLKFDLTRVAGDGTAAAVQVQTGSTYELEFSNNGGTLTHDTTEITSSTGIGRLQLGLAATDSWKLDLNALNDISGLVSAAGEFNLFTWNQNIDFFINGTVAGANTSGTVNSVALSSTDFNISGASVKYEVLGDFSGRVYVTGLNLLPGSGSITGANVPEPATCSLVALALAMMVAVRRREAV
jgi:hypothetical protein